MDSNSGRSSPLGASPSERGVNFSVYSRTATGMQLLLFNTAEDSSPSQVFELDPQRNRTFHYWHLEVPGLVPGQVYGWRTQGPEDPEKGFRFDPQKLLLDPYARSIVVPSAYSREAARRPGDTTATAMKCVVADRRGYDWEGDTPLGRPLSETVIYEMHLAGFTRHPNSGVAPEKCGTYSGLIEKIPYLVDLGVTAVELLPVFQFDSQDAPPGLTNYWGYCPVSFFAPHAAYSSSRDLLGPVHEFRSMVKALHRAGIEIILDVVYNHTTEGDENGPTISLRGLDNVSYYLLDADDPRTNADFSGTGNTLNANGSVVRRMILDSLHYWVEEMHVDGFRFDLASILSRDGNGEPLENPPILWDIETDPVLAGTKLIAEAWDAGGLYQVGSFLGDRWVEWNGVFRDDVRRFIRGDQGAVSQLPARLLASPDLYGHEEREPEQSINFVTCHDGFTVNDLVSYEAKHNENNREDNRDGNDHNFSSNNGMEGPSSNAEIEALRNRQVKNLMALTLISLGTPMLSMGDEVRRTQGGNNNAFCQDNEISWFDWSLLDRHGDVHRFVKYLIALRLHPEHLSLPPGMTLNRVLETAHIRWHGIQLDQPDWSDTSHSLALTMRFSTYRLGHLMLNAWFKPLDFELPLRSPAASGDWRRLIDTSLPAPHDVTDEGQEAPINQTGYRVEARSLVLLVAPLSG
ncbi:MAG: glycogen debranching protein GlgX [Thermoanaerobaculales bacterium]|nr:glycogen debranching protein GlgX [Thermoanaerobaculales bacterium]